MAAGYCDIVNHGAEPVTIEAFAASPPAATLRIEMHETTHADGMARMRRLHRLAIAANASVSLQPGGKHLMLFGMDADVRQITLRAVFANGNEIGATFAVRPFASEASP